MVVVGTRQSSVPPAGVGSVPASPPLNTYLRGCLALWRFMSLHKYCQLL